MRIFSDLSGNGMGVGVVNQAFLEAEIDAAESTTSVRVNGNFNASLYGTFAGTFRLERSLDDGTTWEPLTVDGSVLSYTSTMSESFYEPEPQALYRWRCTAYTSGTATCRIGK